MMSLPERSCGAPADSERFTSLTKEQVLHFQERFRYPERFIRVNGNILCLREAMMDAE